MEEDQDFSELLHELISVYHLPLEKSKKEIATILGRLSATPPKEKDATSLHDNYDENTRNTSMRS